ncbi:short-chain dehydrogenase/reductase-like protein SDR [Hyaloscypha variabilis F]|uniref:D-arabinitol 2-dehydrogenase [ribulose-forming] n=1 Tax=Hyaloscypha variabilis (strain UAMH 11265 / GT02V1 / F) TaxID=1149755 RepID=A0A2J6RL62_HYAVF|nr:short-chain dehydrogenase/reductase-like protein SDR [Hyaloscypha variabilis F]
MAPLLSPMARRGLLGRSIPFSLGTARHRRTVMTLPSFSLEGKTCLVTGAARGLGKEFLTAFALSGARGACVDLSLQAGRSSVKHITEHIASQPSTPSSYTPELRAYACDVTSEEQVQETWDSVVKDFGKVDVVVTAAGIVENFEAENYEYSRWLKMFDINVNGSFLFAKQAGKHWIDNSMKGNLILVSSMSSIICVRPQKQAAYNASKAAVSLLGRSLATEWGPKGIRVNSLCPGYMKTDLIIDLLAKEGRHIEEGWVKDVPMGRLGRPHELQGTIVWMASDASSYLNGSDIVVDGGYCCW